MTIIGISNLKALANVVYLNDAVKPTATIDRQAVSAGGNPLPQPPADAQPEMDASQALRNILEYVPNLSRDLQFQVDESTDSAVITVLDSQTNEVVRQIPSEEFIAIARYLVDRGPDAVSGLLLDGEG